MNLQRLRIQNFKSLVDLEIVNPNPFTVFVGPNAAGKSNIFEALELWNYILKFSLNSTRLFGRSDSANFNSHTYSINFETDISNRLLQWEIDMLSGNGIGRIEEIETHSPEKLKEYPDVYQFVYGFLRLFIRNSDLEKINYNDSERLTISARNLEKVLKRVLKEENTKEEFLEWVQLFIPEFENIEIHTDSISGDDNFLIYEKHSKKPFNKSLISDGTYNILALLTAVFQSDEPQFLCIEEPENGLHPKVVKELVNFFRSQCEEKGHYIWLNTHSQTLVSQLKPEEIIVVNKKEGATQIKQFKEEDFHGLSMDEAWLTNALGGGLPW